MNRIILFALLLPCMPAIAQNFYNGDLNGTIITTSDLPTGWQSVPYTDPVSQAPAWQGATPDLTGLTGPDTAWGIMGNPFSGTTFVSGAATVGWFHEGIMQTVSGLTPGSAYTIRFHQAVVKQRNMLDRSGSWEVYIDTSLAGITASSFSTLPYGSTSLVWELRTIVFTATASSHVFKFLPKDDDPNSLAAEGDTTDGALRMGIDSIGLYAGGEMAGVFTLNGILFSVYPNPASDQVNVRFGENFNGCHVLLLDVSGRYVSTRYAEFSSFTVDLSGLAAGIYFLRLEMDDHVSMVKILKE